MNKMSGNLKIFLIILIFGLPFWWGLNIFQKNLEDFLFWQEIAENPQILASQTNLEILEKKLRSLKPRRNWEVKNLEIQAKSGLTVFTNEMGKQKIIFEKNSNQILPIASLTKLMTALIVLRDSKNYNFSKVITISKEAASQENIPEGGNLKTGEKITIEKLLNLMLVQSSNDAAFALAEVLDIENFARVVEPSPLGSYPEVNSVLLRGVEKMNAQAEELGLENTHFVNPTGLDPENLKFSEETKNYFNYSTAQNLSKLAQYILNEFPIIYEISTNKPAYPIKNGLSDLVFNKNIIGGKTGYTEEAQGCFLLILKSPKEKGYLINIILGSKDRLEEMKKLINWINQAYKW